jgi:hypothetical protein
VACSPSWPSKKNCSIGGRVAFAAHADVGPGVEDHQAQPVTQRRTEPVEVRQVGHDHVRGQGEQVLVAQSDLPRGLVGGSPNAQTWPLTTIPLTMYASKSAERLKAAATARETSTYRLRERP